MYRKGTTLVWCSRNHGGCSNRSEDGESSRLFNKSDSKSDGAGESVGNRKSKCDAAINNLGSNCLPTRGVSGALSTTELEGNRTASVSEKCPSKERQLLCVENTVSKRPVSQLPANESSIVATEKAKRSGAREERGKVGESTSEKEMKDCSQVHALSTRSRPKRNILVLHEDIISDSFWKEHPDIINS